MLRSRRSRVAFTLIELLVVIGIIAVLIALLMPSLQRAKVQAQRVACMSNLRQFGQMQRLYAHDNRGIVPGWGLRATPTLDVWARNEAFLKYFSGTVKDLATSKVIAANMLRCEACPFRNDTWTISLARYFRLWVHLSATPRPAEVLVAGDSFVNSNSTTGLIFENLTFPALPSVWFGHGGYATLLMADGHVECKTRNELPVWRDQGNPSTVKVFRAPGYKSFWIGARVHDYDGTTPPPP